ncbi:hypothetical protein [Scytonema sp. HK-05]|uniref:hypothetical protein n=1 Tax=Scytonema sp. HK-05 TaxID=1137095 RepID=UPI001300D1D7|nr:hypothetical protein [Scytonema sp. HK-05]
MRFAKLLKRLLTRLKWNFKENQAIAQITPKAWYPTGAPLHQRRVRDTRLGITVQVQ